jgi:DNA-binding NarL/FixJ family response regulator
MLLPDDFPCNSAERSRAPHSTVLIGGGHMLVRYGLRMFVADIMGDVHHVEVEDLDALMQAARSHPTAQLALLDAAMSGMPGGLRLHEFARRHPRIPLVVITAAANEEGANSVLDVPTVHAFVPSNANANALRAVIKSALRGKSLSRSVVNRSRMRPRACLTPRQRQIRALLRQGMSNKMIAGALGISTGTVKNHVSDIFRALNATNRTQAARLDAGTE